MKFNINNEVKVKLTETGHAILKGNHVKQCEILGNDYGYNPPKEDSEGWSKWQLWVLMDTFGGHIFNSAKVPFETEIEILEEETV